MKSISRMTLDEMNIEIERLAKRANVRIRALEKSTDPETELPLYKAAELTLEGSQHWSPGRPRFSRAKATTVASARSRLKNLNKFLKMKSSTATGRKEIIKQRFKTFKSNYNFTGTISDYKRLTILLNRVDYFRDSQEIVDLAIDILNREGKLPTVEELLKFIERNPVDPVSEYNDNIIDWSEYTI